RVTRVHDRSVRLVASKPGADVRPGRSGRAERQQERECCGETDCSLRTRARDALNLRHVITLPEIYGPLVSSAAEKACPGDGRTVTPPGTGSRGRSNNSPKEPSAPPKTLRYGGIQ